MKVMDKPIVVSLPAVVTVVAGHEIQLLLLIDGDSEGGLEPIPLLSCGAMAAVV